MCLHSHKDRNWRSPQVRERDILIEQLVEPLRLERRNNIAPRLLLIAARERQNTKSDG